MVYSIADAHFGHANIIRHCSRPFASVEEMDTVLLENWRRRVSDDDTVYILGDLMFFCKNPKYYLRQLTGRKHLIVGNHDKVWMKKVHAEDYFESIQLMLEIRIDGRNMTLCHYPMMTWDGAAEGSYLIYGHIHNNTKDVYWPLLRQTENAVNAGVEINGYMLVMFEEMVENNQRLRMECAWSDSNDTILLPSMTNIE